MKKAAAMKCFLEEADSLDASEMPTPAPADRDKSLHQRVWCNAQPGHQRMGLVHAGRRRPIAHQHHLQPLEIAQALNAVHVHAGASHLIKRALLDDPPRLAGEEGVVLRDGGGTR
ncbi:hypothetical protein [Ideonella oryzae]|uniref:Uncharacterized protein n=1 Tax=Ideonella oryzae TaxID=2937441 RepID=A0ABT1BR87_9BURK|nr:hypothetical protein [Ideonella oryzae]MCO5978752.1 hypothetical protein [Ideonella oryzae]